MFEQRSKEEELLDSQECDPEIATESYRFMEKVNRMFGGIRHVRDFIEKEARKHTGNRPLRILDIGSGTGNLLNYLLKNSCKNIFGVDNSSEQLDICRKFVSDRVIQDDMFHFLRTTTSKFDFIFLFTPGDK